MIIVAPQLTSEECELAHELWDDLMLACTSEQINSACAEVQNASLPIQTAIGHYTALALMQELTPRERPNPFVCD